MSQLSDQQEHGTSPQTGPSVFKKNYPGLVFVPPSDRTILRRRLIRGALLLVAVIWAMSIFVTRLPDADLTANCQSESDRASLDGTSENCDPAPSTTQTNAQPSEFNLTQVAQLTPSVEASPLPSTTLPDPGQPQAKPIVEPHAPASTESTDRPIAPQAKNPDHEHPPAGARLPEKPLMNPESDTRLAEQGDPFAQYRLGRHFAKQDGRQAQESVSWYKKAFPGLHRLAESGNGQAMYVLGVMYAYGRGIERDISQARRWLSQAVRQNVTAAQPVLASLPMPPRANSHLHAAEQAKTRKQQN